MSNGPLQRGVVDTALLIAIRDGDQNAPLFAVAMLRHHPIEVSELSAMAVIARSPGAAELQQELAFLANSRVHRVSASTSRWAFRILQRLPPPCGPTPDDAIVAATAIESNLPLYTLDPARFAAVPGLTATRPY